MASGRGHLCLSFLIISSFWNRRAFKCCFTFCNVKVWAWKIRHGYATQQNSSSFYFPCPFILSNQLKGHQSYSSFCARIPPLSVCSVLFPFFCPEDKKLWSKSSVGCTVMTSWEGCGQTKWDTFLAHIQLFGNPLQTECLTPFAEEHWDQKVH